MIILLALIQCIIYKIIKKRLIEISKSHLSKEEKIIIGDIAFETRELLERCKMKYENYWDDEEIYFVFDELKDSLLDEKIDFIATSHCAGIIQMIK